MKLKKNDIVTCHDQNEYVVQERTPDNYVIGVDLNNGSQRLFKPDGSYAGSDKAKNVAKVL